MSGGVSEPLPLRQVKPGRLVQRQDTFVMGIVMSKDKGALLRVLELGTGKIGRWAPTLAVRDVNPIEVAQSAINAAKAADTARVLLAALILQEGGDSRNFMESELIEARNGWQFNMEKREDATIIRLERK